MTEEEKQTRQLRLIHAQLCPLVVLFKAGLWIAVSGMAFGILAALAGVFKKG
jgi:uncharacterized membrane protein